MYKNYLFNNLEWHNVVLYTVLSLSTVIDPVILVIIVDLSHWISYTNRTTFFFNYTSI